MTNEFSSDWLALREPYDAAARSKRLAAAFLEALPARPCILDLGAGRGANARFLDGLGSGDICWRLVDRDPILLKEASQMRAQTDQQIVDFAPDPALLDLSQADAVSASALFDLVSVDWFERFLRTVGGVPLLFALTADGEFRWRPSDSADVMIMARFEADMRRDKGFGPAMGADAPRLMAALLSEEGYLIRPAQSSWRLGAGDSAILTILVDLIADATRDLDGRPEVEGWRARRHHSIAMNDLSLEVGHIDLLALLD
ncbi:MAG: class I SAM-dependent methyltransferase [Alphaproteobacteria bacterium]|nr:class I SAM-dependent methyltransferase [Alphaproteobacteria bacterium]